MCGSLDDDVDESPENVEACDSLASLASELEPAPAYLEAERLRMPAAAPCLRRRGAAGAAASPEVSKDAKCSTASMVEVHL